MNDPREEELRRVRPDTFGIDPLILTRWSPRSFLSRPVQDADLFAVLEAARWAPSCFNEQPWRFIVARKEEDLARLRACLSESNRIWAVRAPVLMVVLSTPKFSLDGSPNRWHAFDSGAAWGYLALEAHRRGLVAHGMGGFSQKMVRETYKVPEEWGVHALAALGYQDSASELPAHLQEREHPSPRKPLEEIWAEGRFGF